MSDGLALRGVDSHYEGPPHQMSQLLEITRPWPVLLSPSVDRTDHQSDLIDLYVTVDTNRDEKYVQLIS